MEAALLTFVQTVNSYLSNYVLIILLIGTGLFFTIKTRFVQVRCFGEGLKGVFGNFSLNGGKHKSGMSSFQALATAIAAQVGTGNIVGACGAILIGGPGAIFWMWVIAFLGMATNYAEAVLAQKTRRVDADGTVHGGPVYYIRTAFKGKFGKFLAGFFAIAIVLALGIMGCMVQSNSIASTCNTAFGIPTWIMGLIIVIAGGFIFLGGVSRIASVTEKMVPIMAVIYLIGGIGVLIVNASEVPAAFALIFECAFNPQASVGGVTFGLIAALSQGAKRGLFSNEAGMGSTPHAHAMANVKNPHEQGVVAIVAVFVDTFVVVTITALTCIVTLYVGDGLLAQGLYDSVDKTNMAQIAFGSLFGTAGGNIFVAVCLLFFAFSTIISWNLFAKINIEYLFGKKAVPVFSCIALVFIFIGSLLANDLVWELADMFNQLMVLPNAIALIALGGAVSMCAKTRGQKMEFADKKAESADAE
ncbi:alanine glycine permease [Slackia faecicanis]|uniref:Alanine glycine permease n=1 Tax=Slackia faecicanis TaxID=255723 RepID=A0A3N0AGX0_9ACTN|nr:sodium:alanine symporter family protein [Slackia faecicanis]RNL20690.1 alanine glycine permease [Slackia faecicanis]